MDRLIGTQVMLTYCDLFETIHLLCIQSIPIQ